MNATKTPHPQATHTGEAQIGGIALPCYVLENEMRVISQNGMLAALGMSRGQGGERLARFASQERFKPFITTDLLEGIGIPVLFIPPQGGGPSYGYEATILADLCEVILAAREAGHLLSQQMHIASQAEALLRSFASVGIIALIDEATGYQDYRTKKALQKILERLIQENLRPWIKTFPDDFYKEMFRLRGWSYNPWSVNRPSVVGKYTNDLVYSRLAPGVLKQLQQINPARAEGGRDHHHHRHLTQHEGYPTLKAHLSNVITLMRAAPNWRSFMKLINRAIPKYDDNYEILFDDEDSTGPYAADYKGATPERVAKTLHRYQPEKVKQRDAANAGKPPGKSS